MQLNEKRAAEKVTKEDESKFRKQEIEGKELDKKVEELRREKNYTRRIKRTFKRRPRSTSY